jgi:hypothetical protein
MGSYIVIPNELPSSLSDVYKRAMLVNEINAPLIQGKGVPSAGATLSLVDLDNNGKSQRGSSDRCCLFNRRFGG